MASFRKGGFTSRALSIDLTFTSDPEPYDVLPRSTTKCGIRTRRNRYALCSSLRKFRLGACLGGGATRPGLALLFYGASSALASLTSPLPVCTIDHLTYENSLEEGTARLGEGRAMNKREMADLVELVERIDRLIHEYMQASTVGHETALRAELEEATDKLKRIALSLQN